jgi:hypothetical protein
MPHEPAPPSPPPELAIAPAPRVATGPPPPPRIVTLDLFMPDVVYVLPSDLRKAPRVILRGKVKALKVISLDNGQVLDASGLTAETVSVSGRVGNGSVLKVNAPGGIVNINEGISGKSSVEINAPGGEVRFTRETRPGRPGSEIDGGSTVTITARRVDLRGDVNGIETRVTVNLTDDGWLWAEAVRGIATVEYRTANSPGKPSASAGIVTPTATFRQIK